MTPAGIARLRLDEAVGGKPPLTAYQDAVGVWTIGWGCTGAGVGPGVVWSLAQAEAALIERIDETERGLRARLAWFEPLRRGEPVRADVLANIAFNIGVAGLSRWPVTLAAVRAGDWAHAAEDILGNALWRNQVHQRCDRCAQAMRMGRWAEGGDNIPARGASELTGRGAA
jgi:lysozyme